MGGAASTPTAQKAEAKSVVGPNSNHTKATELTESPFDDLGAAGGILGEDDMDNQQKGVASATKLKRMAFGQQTYMDQQRDYDQTLSKLDLNKTGVVDWKGPVNSELGTPSPQKASKFPSLSAKSGKLADSSGISPGDGKASTSTPDGAKRANARKPPPPTAKPNGANVMSPVQQVVAAPNHTPTRVQQIASNSPVGGQGHSASFSAQQQPHARNMQLHPDHNSSGTQLLPQHKHNNNMAGAQSGPPPGLISRPFPHQRPQLDSASADMDDAMIADFGRSIKVDTFKKPDNIPMLSINSPAGDPSARVQPPRNNPQLGPVVTMGMGMPSINSKGNLSLVSPAVAAPGSFSGGPARAAAAGGAIVSGGSVSTPSPGALHGAVGVVKTPNPHGGSNPSSGLPSPMIQPVRQMGGGPHATPPSTAGGTGARPVPAPVPHGGAPLSAPVVKETKNVKRNRAQIPTQLAHALPTTGDWMNKRYIVNNYILLEVLGTGSYGEVRLCKDRTTDKLFAIKIFSKDFLKKKKAGKSDETFFEDIKREIAIMKKLLHPNVLRLFEVLDDPKVNKMYLVLEYMKMGDLINVLKSRGANAATNTTTVNNADGSSAEGTFTPLTDLEVWNIFRQVVSGIRYLHYQNVVHGDIKPQNLLLGEDGLVKIADFGISQMLSASGQKLADAAGTPAFMSPELCQGQSFSGQLADIWAIGATMFMLRFGHPPFLAKSIINLYNKICNDPLVFPGPIDPGLKNLLENLLEKDPTKRYTLQQIIMHPWFRHPPSLQVQQQQQQQQQQLQQQQLQQQQKQNHGNAAAASSSSHSNPGSTSEAIMNTTNSSSMHTSFKPPDSYAAEEAAAMKVPPVKIEHNDEVYMSIGGIQAREKAAGKGSGSGGKGKIEEESKGESECNSEVEEGREGDEDGENMMNTDWGADVFQMVDDGDNSDNNIDDDDSVDDESDDGDNNNDHSKASGLKGGMKSKHGSDGSMMATHTEMTAEEGEKRARRFQAKILRKSNEDMALSKGNASSGVAESRDSSQASVASTKKRSEGLDRHIGAGTASDPPSETSSSAATPKMTRLPFKAVSSKIAPRTRGESIRNSTASRDDDGDDADELSMEDFNKIMDTLAMQPKKFSSMAQEDISDKSGGMLPIDGFSAEILNKKNGIAAAFNSEKGSRPTQEDRCVLLPNVSVMKGIEEANFDAAKLEILSQFSIGCIFDGHSGWRCAQYLTQHFAPSLVRHEKFLDKSCVTSLMEVCAAIDEKVCEMLMDEEDSSGSTGVIAVYDGRKHIFTVAGVGDSMCVLSRAGKAVILNRMHRLDNEDERERVKKAGGTIINNRVNGLLAISRAFGDTQFKPDKDDSNWNSNPQEGKLVISTPEVYSEIITPMTEFAVMATDGLWDVMTAQMAVTFVRNMLHKHRDLEEAARALTKEALNLGSVDNVTVLIISFHFSDEGKIKSAKM